MRLGLGSYACAWAIGVPGHVPLMPLSATGLFERQASRRGMICLFLAILELVKRQALVLTQSDAFGDIGLEAGPGIDEAFGSDEQISAIEQEYK